MTRRLALCGLMLWLGAIVLAACGDDDQVVGVRGAPGGAPGGAKAETKEGGKQPSRRGPRGGPAEEVAEPVPDHPKRVLTREDFAAESRDPFQRLDGSEGIDVSDAPRDLQRQREVRLSEYNFEDLKLIGIVMSGRGIQPRALFLATDRKSKSVKVGEYFSRAEVLLAAVNRDYIEIEVVDEELARGLNMAAGERRPIYLKKD